MSDFENRYSNLNEQQKQAVDTIDGPVLVIAGPGSGKTELLGLRVAKILKETDVYPSNILCLTFTESAAFNMRERLQQLIGTDANRVSIHTFHSFGTDIIQHHPEYFFGPANFSGADELVQAEILEGIFSKLDHDSPLASTHPQQGFVYLRDVKGIISQLKQGGMSVQSLKDTVTALQTEIEQLQPVIQEYIPGRISKKVLPQFDSLLAAIQAIPQQEYSDTIESYLSVCGQSLQQAIEASAGEITAPLSAWKKEWIETKTVDREKQFVLKDAKYIERLEAVVDIYEQYMKQLHANGYYDFDDMLVDVIEAMENYEGLRLQIQEQFQYILVDEFQDTNDAQMKLLHLLTEADVWEGKPNILAVGDDDQAVYKFQGANIKNIQSFTDWYPATQVVTLTKNYRSTQEILNAAMHVIRQGEERLENMLDDVEKELEAANPHLEYGDIEHIEFRTEEEEYHWVVSEIQKKIDTGISPADIAIITRKHASLQAMVPYLEQQHIPFRYQKQLNVLEQPHIYQLIQTARTIIALQRSDNIRSNELLVEVLSYPFWGIDREALWQLSLQWHRLKEKNDTKWIELMERSEQAQLRQCAEWFKELAHTAKHAPLSEMLDAMMGAHDMQLADTAVDEDNSDLSSTEHNSPGIGTFKQFYFSEDVLQHRPQEYMQFLSALRVFVKSAQEYKKGQFMKLSDLLEFVDYYQKNNSGLYDMSVYATAEDAVELLTAHKAKGLEYDHVYVVGCTEENWAGNRGARNLIRFPKNLAHLSTEKETTDDYLRLFYVALTRAKTHLTMTLHTEKQFSRAHQPLSFIETTELAIPDRMQQTAIDTVQDMEAVLSHEWQVHHIAEAPSVSEKALLRPILENYQMSVTHLNNFLNVQHGGPQQFFLDNLLRFPQSMSDSARFGTAMHAAVQYIYTRLKAEDSTGIPTLEEVQDHFEIQLRKQPLNERGLQFWLKKGKEALVVYMEERTSFIESAHIIEHDFRNQEVCIGEARITGKIDKMEPISESEIRVVDFKTGKAIDNWKRGDAVSAKVKLYNYKRQLVFYKLLVEGSAEYRNYTVDTGALEFLEPKDGKIIVLEDDITDEEVERLQQLIQIVFKKIQDLDFPDISAYNPNNLQGILDFENDLLSGAI